MRRSPGGDVGWDKDTTGFTVLFEDSKSARGDGTRSRPKGCERVVAEPSSDIFQQLRSEMIKKSKGNSRNDLRQPLTIIGGHVLFSSNTFRCCSRVFLSLGSTH